MTVHFTFQGQDATDATVTVFEQTLTIVPNVREMSEEQLAEHLLLLKSVKSYLI